MATRLDRRGGSSTFELALLTREGDFWRLIALLLSLDARPLANTALLYAVTRIESASQARHAKSLWNEASNGRAIALHRYNAVFQSIGRKIAGLNLKHLPTDFTCKLVQLAISCKPGATGLIPSLAMQRH
jgi:hypothetical protein